MPLVLNLHHEIDRQRAIKRRDPLKFAMMGLGVIVLGFAGYYVYDLAEVHAMETERSTAEAEYKKLEKKAELAKKEEEELNLSMKSCETMVKRVEGRFYWAPVLGALMQVVPREVQITKLSGDVSGDLPRRCSITVEGIAAGSEPRKLAEELRKSLNDQFAPKYRNVVASFRTLEDSNEQVKINGQPAKTADFAITVQLQFGDEPPPPPQPKKRRQIG